MVLCWQSYDVEYGGMPDERGRRRKKLMLSKLHGRCKTGGKRAGQGEGPTGR